MIWVVAYDISDDRRRLAVARVLQRHGVRIQRSVFECEFTADEREGVMGTVAELMDPGRDVLQAFPLCGRCSAGRTAIGSTRQALDEPFIVF